MVLNFVYSLGTCQSIGKITKNYFIKNEIYLSAKIQLKPLKTFLNYLFIIIYIILSSIFVIIFISI